MTLKLFTHIIKRTDDPEETWHVVSMPDNFRYAEVLTSAGGLGWFWKPGADGAHVAKALDPTDYPLTVHALYDDGLSETHRCPNCGALHPKEL